ncbi:MAG: AMP-binding protein, partial [Acidobacteriota bacterium]
MKRPPLLPAYPLRDLRELVFQAEERKGNRPAIKTKRDGKWQATSYRQLRERVGWLATFYSESGLKKGDRISVLSENRTEWCVAYLAAVSSGFVAVPIDRDLKPREVKHILNFAGSRLLVCGGDYLNALEGVKDDVPSLLKVVSMDEQKGDAGITYQEALKQGKKASRSNPFFEQASVAPDDLAAIIFTSGTTGSSKGVMLTHANLAADIVATSQHVSVADEKDVMLSVLPLHHTYECTGGFLMALFQGSLICHAESLRRIPENMVETKTTIMLGVPLLFEAIYRRIEE